MVAPASFTDPSQYASFGHEVDVFEIFRSYPNSNKSFIFSVSSSATSITLNAAIKWHYGYTDGGINYDVPFNGGTLTWVVGSTKRWVIGLGTNYASYTSASSGQQMLFCGNRINSIYITDRYAFNTIFLSNPEFLTIADIYRRCLLTGVFTIPINFPKAIPDYFCQENNLLTSISFLNSPISIGQYAFSTCTGITSFVTPSTVTTIGTRAFVRCTGLTSFTFSPLITTITYGLFQECTSLASITIPSSVTLIEDIAFIYCNAITLINCLAVIPPTMSADSFSVNRSIPLHVPVGSRAAYQANALWNTFTNIIEDL